MGIFFPCFDLTNFEVKEFDELDELEDCDWDSSFSRIFDDLFFCIMVDFLSEAGTGRRTAGGFIRGDKIFFFSFFLAAASVIVLTPFLELLGGDEGVAESIGTTSKSEASDPMLDSRDSLLFPAVGFLLAFRLLLSSTLAMENILLVLFFMAPIATTVGSRALGADSDWE